MKTVREQAPYEEMLEAYYSGMTVKQVALKFSVSSGTAYNVLMDHGCSFRNPGFQKGREQPREWAVKRGATMRGVKKSIQTRRRMSEAAKKHFDSIKHHGNKKRSSQGYIRVYVPDHPFATKDGYVMEHRLIMEAAIGRYLLPNESIHHKNHIRDDNRIENLALMSNHDHHSLHMKEYWRKRRNAI